MNGNGWRAGIADEVAGCGSGNEAGRDSLNKGEAEWESGWTGRYSLFLLAADASGPALLRHLRRRAVPASRLKAYALRGLHTAL